MECNSATHCRRLICRASYLYRLTPLAITYVSCGPLYFCIATVADQPSVLGLPTICTTSNITATNCCLVRGGTPSHWRRNQWQACVLQRNSRPAAMSSQWVGRIAATTTAVRRATWSYIETKAHVVIPVTSAKCQEKERGARDRIEAPIAPGISHCH